MKAPRRKAARHAAPDGFAHVYHAVKEALEREQDGYRFDDLASAAGLAKQDLQRYWRNLVSCNLMLCDRQSGRWILR